MSMSSIPTELIYDIVRLVLPQRLEPHYPKRARVKIPKRQRHQRRPGEIRSDLSLLIVSRRLNAITTDVLIKEVEFRFDILRDVQWFMVKQIRNHNNLYNKIRNITMSCECDALNFGVSGNGFRHWWSSFSLPGLTHADHGKAKHLRDLIGMLNPRRLSIRFTDRGYYILTGDEAFLQRLILDTEWTDLFSCAEEDIRFQFFGDGGRYDLTIEEAKDDVANWKYSTLEPPEWWDTLFDE